MEAWTRRYGEECRKIHRIPSVRDVLAIKARRYREVTDACPPDQRVPQPARHLSYLLANDGGRHYVRLSAIINSLSALRRPFQRASLVILGVVSMRTVELNPFGRLRAGAKKPPTGHCDAVFLAAGVHVLVLSGNSQRRKTTPVIKGVQMGTPPPTPSADRAWPRLR